MNGFEALRERHPWPDIEDVRGFAVELDGGGRELVHGVLFDRRVTKMLQIGCLLNGSVARWLRAHPELRIVGVDSWDDAYLDVFDDYIRDPVMIPLLGDVGHRGEFVATLRRQGFFRTALAAVSEHRDRFVPVRGGSPAALGGIAQTGFTPELVYVDADKKPDDLDAAADLWPDAILCGDDWSWGAKQGFPMRRHVESFAERRGYEAFGCRATWMLRPRAV